ncbi:hypothetical protein M8C21_006664, partial [Ambrosia artemisiifolia]
MQPTYTDTSKTYHGALASLENIPKDSTITPNNLDDFTNDDYSKVKGLEKRGYIRLIGRMPAAK